MKYLSKYKLFESASDIEKRRHKWLISKKHDIIDCSHDLTDMPYNFRHCGRPDVEQGERISDVLFYNTIDKDNQYKRANTKDVYYKNNFFKGDNYNRGSFEIRYTGEILGKHIEEIHRGYVFGKWDNGFEYRNDRDSYRPNKIINEILPNLEDTIVKLKNVVFKRGEYNIYFMINMYGVERGTCIYIRVIFKPIEGTGYPFLTI